MELLKYLDVLIGLALVMVLLSPLVSAFTQFWMWFSNTRAGRLQAGLKSLILQLQGNGYNRFDSIIITGYLPAGNVTISAQGFAPVSAVADPNGSVVFDKDVAAILKAANGNPTFTPAPGPAQVITASTRGSVGGWRLQSPLTTAAGTALVRYDFPGEAQFASWQAVATVPAGAGLQARIVGGVLDRTALIVNAAPPVLVTYPAAARPVPASHDLELTLTMAGAPVVGQPVTLEFERNGSFDSQFPLPAPVVTTLADADEIAKQVLLHPMVAQPSFLKILRWKNSQRGEVIVREEFIRILLEFAAGEGAGGSGLSTGARVTLQQLMRENGILNPAGVLGRIRDRAQQLEKDQPAKAAHERFTGAILSAAPNDFVGKINNWFDQAMERTTAEYKFRAQIVTVIGALIVAFAVQMDSLDLLKRLSTGDKLRESLVTQAQEQQKRLDDQYKTTKPDQDEIQLARARREEIEGNLSRLRDPQMAILPDHFIWQPLPQARLIHNPAWSHPYPKQLELVVGSTSFSIEPKWSTDPLLDIRAAIEGSGAPVSMHVEPHRDAVVRANDVVSDLDQLKVFADGMDQLIRAERLAETKFQNSPLPNENLDLLAGYGPIVGIKADKNGKISTALQNSKLPVTVVAGETAIRATEEDVRWIELRRKDGAAQLNILKPVTFIKRIARLDSPPLLKAKNCKISVAGNEEAVKCDLGEIVDALHKRGMEARLRDHLVVVSRRNPPLQLRSTPGRPESNVFNSALEQSCSFLCIDGESFKRSLLGLAVTWMLLSLGAPFWYDALKDLLKLRSSLAKKEEDARSSRIADTTQPKPKTT